MLWSEYGLARNRWLPFLTIPARDFIHVSAGHQNPYAGIRLNEFFRQIEPVSVREHHIDEHESQIALAPVEHLAVPPSRSPR